MLLPHGFEGQGPEHSSARIERFLQLCAENNMQVCNCTTPAQYFHLLRRQMHGGPTGEASASRWSSSRRRACCGTRRPSRTLDEFTTGSFHEVMDDLRSIRTKVTRVLFCSGKVYYDLLAAREERKAEHVAIVRVEQMYPFPQAQIEACWRGIRRPRRSTGCRRSRATWVRGASSASASSRCSILPSEYCTTWAGRRARARRRGRASGMSRSSRIWSATPCAPPCHAQAETRQDRGQAYRKKIERVLFRG